MAENPYLVFFGIFLVSMLFVPPSIPFMVPEAEAATYTISVDPSVGIGFSQSALTIAQGDSVTFTTTVPPPQWVSITDPAGGFHQFDTNNPVTWTFNQCGIIVFWDESSPAQFAPMTLTVGDCPPDTTPPTITLPSNLVNGVTILRSDLSLMIGGIQMDGYSFETGTVFQRSFYTTDLTSITFTDNVAIDTSIEQGNLPDGLSCDNEIIWYEHHPSWQGFPIGDTIITCTVSDTSGNTATASFTILVAFDGIPEGADTTPPTLTVPSDITQTTTDPAGVVVPITVSATAGPIVLNTGCAPEPEHYTCQDGDWPNPSCQDPSGNVSISGMWSGSNVVRYFSGTATFPVGTTTVTCTATDAAGSVGTASFSITVNYEGQEVDTTPPVISFIELQTMEVWVGSQQPTLYGSQAWWGNNGLAGWSSDDVDTQVYDESISSSLEDSAINPGISS